jgi:hypothetical protein
MGMDIGFTYVVLINGWPVGGAIVYDRIRHPVCSGVGIFMIGERSRGRTYWRGQGDIISDEPAVVVISPMLVLAVGKSAPIEHVDGITFGIVKKSQRILGIENGKKSHASYMRDMTERDTIIRMIANVVIRLFAGASC